MRIKAIDLVSIAVGAELWFKVHDEITHDFRIELEAAKKLKEWLYSVEWNEGAELLIDELPF